MNKEFTPILFDQFLLVCLREENQTYVPYVKDVYPPNTAPTPNVALFCFPEDIDSKSLNQIKIGASFFFVLTDVEGRQQVGFTRRILGASSTLPQCLCLLTHIMWERLFNLVLDEAENLLQESKQKLYHFLDTIKAFDVPLPGGHLTIPLHPPQTVVRPDVSTLVDTKLAPLLTTFYAPAIIQIFASLLFERRIIFISADLERITSCVQAAVAALQPFAWHHIFIPVLPKQLLAYCSAPMPFLIGLHTSLLVPLQAMPLSEVVLVDLDRELVRSNPVDVAALPPTIVGPLRSTLEIAVNSVRKTGTTDYAIVAASFRQFFVRIFAGYKRFFVRDLSRTPVRSTFDRETFISAQPKAVAKFLELFCASQMFERFIAEREDHEVISVFEREADAYFLLNSQNSNSNLKTIAVEKLSFMGKYSSVMSIFSQSPNPPRAAQLGHLPSSTPPPTRANNLAHAQKRLSASNIFQHVPKHLPPTAHTTDSIQTHSSLSNSHPSLPSSNSSLSSSQPPQTNSFWDNIFSSPTGSHEASAQKPPSSLPFFIINNNNAKGRPKAATVSAVSRNPKNGEEFNPFNLSPPRFPGAPQINLPPISLQPTTVSPRPNTNTNTNPFLPPNNNPNPFPVIPPPPRSPNNSILNPPLSSSANSSPASSITNNSAPNIFTSISMDDMLAPTEPIITNKSTSPSAVFRPPVADGAQDDFDSFLASRHQV